MREQLCSAQAPTRKAPCKRFLACTQLSHADSRHLLKHAWEATSQDRLCVHLQGVCGFAGFIDSRVPLSCFLVVCDCVVSAGCLYMWFWVCVHQAGATLVRTASTCGVHLCIVRLLLVFVFSLPNHSTPPCLPRVDADSLLSQTCAHRTPSTLSKCQGGACVCVCVVVCGTCILCQPPCLRPYCVHLSLVINMVAFTSCVPCYTV